MENNQEKNLVISKFDYATCHKIALIFYIAYFVFGWVVGWSASGLNATSGFVIGFLFTALIGGIVHCVMYFTSANNKIILTNYKVTGIYSRKLSLNIPIDSISSVAKGSLGSLCITCAGNKYNISFVDNRDAFCSKLNELLNKRTQQALNKSTIITNQTNYDEIIKLKQLLDDGIITQEEFETKKKQLLGL